MIEDYQLKTVGLTGRERAEHKYILHQLFNSIIDQIWRGSHPTVSINPFGLRGLVIMYQPPY
jgi:hypothetical protein